MKITIELTDEEVTETQEWTSAHAKAFWVPASVRVKLLDAIAEQRQIKVGDIVRVTGMVIRPHQWQVLALDDDYAWLRSP